MPSPPPARPSTSRAIAALAASLSTEHPAGQEGGTEVGVVLGALTPASEVDVPAMRRLLAAVGFPVQELVRTDIGTVSLGDQRPGSIRVLNRAEIGELYKAVGM